MSPNAANVPYQFSSIHRSSSFGTASNISTTSGEHIPPAPRPCPCRYPCRAGRTDPRTGSATPAPRRRGYASFDRLPGSWPPPASCFVIRGTPPRNENAETSIGNSLMSGDAEVDDRTVRNFTITPNRLHIKTALDGLTHCTSTDHLHGTLYLNQPFTLMTSFLHYCHLCGSPVSFRQ